MDPLAGLDELPSIYLASVLTSSGVACYFQSSKANGAREKEVVPSSMVTRRRSSRVLRPPPHI